MQHGGPPQGYQAYPPQQGYPPQQAYPPQGYAPPTAAAFRDRRDPAMEAIAAYRAKGGKK